jgi:prepilin-type processing-associated H-X9-DG protein
MKGRGKAFLVAGVAAVLLGAVLLFCAVLWALRADDFRSGVNLKALAIAILTYAEGDYYPPLSAKPGHLMFDVESLYPKYVSDLSLFLSLADPTREAAIDTKLTPDFCFEHSSYAYLGYKVWDDATVEAFATAYKKRIEEGRPFDSDLPVNLPIEKLERLDSAVRRETMIPDSEADNPKWEGSHHSNSEVPCLIEWPHPYPGMLGLRTFVPIPLSKPVRGGTVLYVDGHVEFIPYPGKWPMTPRTINALKALSGLE